jgi:hypothetical protein
MPDLTSLVDEVAQRVEEPAFEGITRRARTRRVRRVGATVTAVGLAAVVSVIALSSTSGRPRALPATHPPTSVTATARPPEQIVNGRNATIRWTRIAPERSGQFVIRDWQQCSNDTLTVTKCDPALLVDAWEVTDGTGRQQLVPPGDGDDLRYAGGGVWVLRLASPQHPALWRTVAASPRLAAPVTLAVDPVRTTDMQSAIGRPHVTCPDQPWRICVVDLSANVLVPVDDLPTGAWAITNQAGWWGILDTGQAVVEQSDGTLLRPELYELVASPTRAFVEDAVDGTIGWYLSTEEDVVAGTPLTALLSSDRGRTWTLRSVPKDAEAAYDWVNETSQDPLVVRAVLPDDWRAWPVIAR